MNEGFLRVASCVPHVSVGDCAANVDNILSLALEADRLACSVAVFPEMSVTAYTCGDLFHNQGLLEDVARSIKRLINESSHAFSCMIVVGAPVVGDGTLYNCAIAIRAGEIIAVVPKTYLPNYNEFYEKRWWSAARDVPATGYIGDIEVTVDSHRIVALDGAKIGFEICEDLWAPEPPGAKAAMAGADIIVNLSASDDLIGKYSYLRSLIAQQSARCLCGYVYASAGYGESSTDLVFDGKAIIAENGHMLASNKRWQSGNQIVVCDIDVAALRHDRMHYGTFNDCSRREGYLSFIVADAGTTGHHPSDLRRNIQSHPFVPETDEAVAERCDEILNIQIAGLAKRLDFIHCRSLVVGISGGLDSTLALLVAVGAYDRLGLDRKGITGVTMPGFGTTGRTHTNAVRLMEQLGVTIREISIVPAVEQHFKDIGHDPSVHDVTYENSQARERTMLLMDIANQTGGIVLGTGDLSELALGWATYNGDHMSMYGVNAGVPKTLVKYLVKHIAEIHYDGDTRATLFDIVDTPVSPELLPADSDGNISQKTEDLVGPYELHDFFLYYTLRFGFSPRRIYMMASKAFDGIYDKETVEKWLRTFLRRFYAQQFKRSCLPDGPKVGSVCLSPRGDWRMPSDAVAPKLDINLR